MTDFTTLADVKAWLSLTSASDDALLTRLITASSVAMQSYLSRDIFQQVYIENYHGKGNPSLLFKNWPVTAVSSVSVDGVSIPASITATGDGYVFDETKLMLRGYIFCRGFSNITISYTAGYATAPYDLAQVCIQLVSLRYKERDRIGHVSKTLAQETVAFSQKDFSDDMRTIMNQYRRVI